MQRIDALETVYLDQPSVVTVGAFDGVHRGHQQLISGLVARARALGGRAVVMSFFPHPDVVLGNISGRYYLTTLEEKARLLAALGVDVLVIHPFDEQIRQIRAATFVDRLLKHLHMVELWATAEFALGYQREGNIAFLSAQGAQKGFAVHTVNLLENGERVSSTVIRAALQSGDLDKATAWLGRAYRVSGVVVHGDARGRTIGFPTANLNPWEEQMLPAHGVYACRAFLGDEVFNAVTNVGKRPTFAGGHVTVEAHILDFDRDIYGQTLTLEFLHRLRGEQKFSGIDALIAQIAQDADQARALLVGG